MFLFACKNIQKNRWFSSKFLQVVLKIFNNVNASVRHFFCHFFNKLLFCSLTTGCPKKGKYRATVIFVFLSVNNHCLLKNRYTI